MFCYANFNRQDFSKNMRKFVDRGNNKYVYSNDIQKNVATIQSDVGHTGI